MCYLVVVLKVVTVVEPRAVTEMITVVVQIHVVVNLVVIDT